MKKRTLAFILALVLMLSIAIPGTLAVSQDSDSTTATLMLDDGATDTQETDEETVDTEETDEDFIDTEETDEDSIDTEETDEDSVDTEETDEETVDTEEPGDAAPAADLVSIDREAIFDPAGVTLYADIGSDDCVFADLPDDFTFTVRYEFTDEDGALWYMLNTDEWADYPEYAAYPFITEESIAFTDEMIPATLEIVQPTAPSDGDTTASPFIKGDTGGSNSFRIPAMVTLSDGTIVAAADARWNTTYDGGGLDTIVARSADGGKNWSYTFANYLGDNGNVYDGSGSTAFIDPSLVAVGGTVYMLCDLYPYGVALNGSGNTPPVTQKGFDSQGRLLLSNNNHNSYDYYLDGDTIYSSNGTDVSGYTVDAYFNLYQNGSYVSNLFFSDSPYQVVRTGYLYLTKSTDGGANWSAPTLLDLKSTGEQVCLVGPGRGLYADGKIIFPVYSYNGSETSQRMGFIWSTDNGATWSRVNSSVNWSSEAAVVALANGTLRFFYRNGTSNLCYVDYSFSTGWSSEVNTGIATNSNTQLSAITYSKTLNGKQVILVSCPTGANEAGSADSSAGARLNGKIFVFTVGENNALEKVNDYDVPSVHSGNYFMYSCLTERSDGSVAILYEDNESGWGTGYYYQMSYKTYTAEDLGLAEAGGETGSNTMTDETTGVTVTVLEEGKTITALVVEERELETTATTVSKSYKIEINGGAYTGAATVTVPYDTAFDGCVSFSGTVEGSGKTDPVAVTYDKEKNTFECDVPHFSTLTITGTRAATGDSETVELTVGQKSNPYTLSGTAAAVTDQLTDNGVAKYTVETTTTPGEATTTYKDSISSGDKIVISDGKNYLVCDANGNLSNTIYATEATLWAVVYRTGGYTLQSGNYYLRYEDNVLSAGTRGNSNTWTYRQGGQTQGFYYSTNGTYYLCYNSGWKLGTGETKAYAYTRTNEKPGSSTTTVTFTGVKPGTTTVTLGGTTFDITVTALSESKTVNVQTESEFTLAPLADLGLSADDGYAISSYNVTAGSDLITRGDGSQFTAGTTDGTATVVATVSKDGATVGTVTYSVVVSKVKITAEQYIHVAVGGTATIDNLSGEIITDGFLNKDIATITPDRGTLNDATLKVSGGKQGSTSIVVGTTRIYIYVHPHNQGSGSNTTKYIAVKVGNIVGCKAYYAINGGELIEIKQPDGAIIIEYPYDLIKQQYTDGFNIMFFATPDDGYALTAMVVTGSANQYYSLSFDDNGNKGKETDGTDTAAWPFKSANPTTVPSEKDSTDWKSGHGFRWPLMEGNFGSTSADSDRNGVKDPIDNLKDLFSRALALGADGVTSFTKNANNDGKETQVYFIAEKLPTLEKSIKSVSRNGEPINYTKETKLEFGDMITYQFTITSYSRYVNFKNIVLKDNDIGYTNNLANGALNGSEYSAKVSINENTSVDDVEKIFGAKIYEPYEGTYTYEKSYQLNTGDIGKYSGGVFENTAELSYDYSTQYSGGSTTASANSSVACKINGMVTYQWDEGLPEQITNLALPADQAPEYGKTETVAPNYTTVIQGNTVTTDDAVYTFKGWENESLTGAVKLYQKDDTFTMPEEESVVFTGVWDFEPYVTINYVAVGPEGCGAVNPASEKLLETTGTAEGSTATANANFRFVGWFKDEACTQPVDTTWVTDNKIVPAKDENGKNVAATYYAKFEYDTTSLTIEKTIEGGKPDQSFVFTVTGGGKSITVVLNPGDFDKGTASKTITGLKVGTTYTVTEDTNWSWRYTPTYTVGTAQTNSITLDADASENVVTVTNSKSDNKWLDGSTSVVNTGTTNGTIQSN